VVKGLAKYGTAYAMACGPSVLTYASSGSGGEATPQWRGAL